MTASTSAAMNLHSRWALCSKRSTLNACTRLCPMSCARYGCPAPAIDEVKCIRRVVEREVVGRIGDDLPQRGFAEE